MARARDPTAERSGRIAAARSSATVTTHLDALRGAGDCGAAFTDDVTLTMMETGEVIHGRTAVATLLKYMHHMAFAAPPAVMTLVAAAERVMVEAEFTGRHTSEFAGIPATGHRVHLPYVVAYDLDAATIRAMRLYFPIDRLIRQLRET